MKRLIIGLAFMFLVGGVSAFSQQASHTTSRRHKAAAQPTPTPVANPKKQKGNSKGQADQKKGPTDITAKNGMDFDNATRTAVYHGDVKVIDPQFTMTSDKLTVHLNKDQDGGGVHDALAEGNVVLAHLNQPKPSASPSPAPVGDHAGQPQPSPTPAQPVLSTAHSERAYYVGVDGSMTLTGWPQVTQGNNTQIALAPDVKMVLFRDGRMKSYGSTRTVIVDKGPNSGNGQPASSPGASPSSSNPSTPDNAAH